jgi:hypothetical protein
LTGEYFILSAHDNRYTSIISHPAGKFTLFKQINRIYSVDRFSDNCQRNASNILDLIRQNMYQAMQDLLLHSGERQLSSISAELPRVSMKTLAVWNTMANSLGFGAGTPANVNDPSQARDRPLSSAEAQTLIDIWNDPSVQLLWAERGRFIHYTSMQYYYSKVFSNPC